MKTWTSALLLALAASTSGCAATAPSGPSARGANVALEAASPARGATPSADAGAREAGTSSAKLALREIAPESLPPNELSGLPAAAPPAACRAESAKGFAGFYATDAWAPGEVVLTFDDGPHPKGTPRVLDLLAQHDLPATFFVVGRAIDRSTYPLVQRIVREGHLLGSHSYSHDVHMTRTHAPAASHEDILGQHLVTTMLVDLALLATSGDDFDAMFRRVFEHDPATWLSASQIRRDHRAFAARHEALLADRGLPPGRRPYDVVYSRPPGGGPYVEHDGKAGVAIHDGALAELSMLNVLWHGASGDTDPARRGDFGFLTANMEKVAKKGGVLLVHDYVRPDALAHALAAIAADPAVRVVTLDDATRAKFGCAPADLTASLRAQRGVVATTSFME